MAEKINLGIDIDTKGASRQLDGLEKAFSAVKVAAAAAVAAFASKQVVDFFSAGIDAAVEQQKAMANLAQQMKLTGDFSETAMGQFEAFADAMETTTQYGDDLVISQLAVAKSFGISNEQAQELVMAATELSAVTGDSLESSVDQLGKTFQGVTGKSPALKGALAGISEEALKAGAGVRAVLDRFSGSAGAQVETFAGSILQAKNAFGNFQESLGNIIINNQTLIEVIRTVREMFSKLEDIVKRNKGAISNFISGGIKALVIGFDVAVEAVRHFVRGLQIFMKTVNLAFNGLEEIVYGWLKLAEVVGIVTPETVKNFEDYQDASIAATAATDKAFDDFLAGYSEFQSGLERRVQSIVDADQKSVKSAKDAVDGRAAAFGEMKSPNAFGEYTYTGNYGKFQGPKPDPQMQDRNWSEIGANVAKGIIGGLNAGGLEGAIQAIGSTAQTALDTFASKMGGWIGAIIQAIQFGMQDPATHDAKVRSFAENLPTALDNLNKNIESMPVIMAENMPAIIKQLIAGFPDFVSALAKGLGQLIKEIFTVEFWAESFGAAFGEMWHEAMEGFVYNIDKFGNWITTASESFKNFPTDLQNAGHQFGVNASNSWKEGIASTVEAFKEFGAKISDFAKDAGNKIADYFKEKIPEIVMAFARELGNAGTQFYNAIIDAGKAFIDAVTPGSSGDNNTNTGYVEEKLGIDVGGGGVSFLTGTGGGGGGSAYPSYSGNGTLEALLTRVVQLLESPQEVYATATVRDQAFADIILRLNRQNARLTA